MRAIVTGEPLTEEAEIAAELTAETIIMHRMLIEGLCK